MVALASILVWGAFAVATGALFAPFSGDEGDYWRRGVGLAEHGWGALADGYRPPLVPALVALASLVVPDGALIPTVRVIGVISTALIPAIWTWAGERRPTDRVAYRCMALASFLWLPFHYLSARILAEPISFLALHVLLVVLLGFRASDGTKAVALRGAGCGALLGLLTLAKANAVLIAPTAAIFCMIVLRRSLRSSLLGAGAMTAATIVLLLPWMLFLHSQTGVFRPANSGGLNLLRGTGYTWSQHLGDERRLHNAHAIRHYGDYRETPMGLVALRSDEEARALLELWEGRETPKGRVAYDNACGEIGARVWREQTGLMVERGALKVLHSHGFSLLGVVDLGQVVLLALVTLAGGILLYHRRRGDLVFLHCGFALTGVLVAFVFLANQRFKTFYFDSTGLLLLGVVLQERVFRPH